MWLLSFIYGLITSLRNWLYDVGVLSSSYAAVPTVVVGNLTVGGTGKTPHTMYVAQLLRISGFKVAILSRGYGRCSKGFLVVGADTTAREVGDEPQMMYCSLRNKGVEDIMVAVSENRHEGIKRLLAMDPTIQVVVLDDALQHRALKPHLSMLLSAQGRPFYADHALPLGRLREWSRGAKRANTIITTKCTDFRSAQADMQRTIWKSKPLFFTGLTYKPLVSYCSSATPANLSRVLLLTAIANPRDMQAYLGTVATEVHTLRFADHHYFTNDDMQKLEREVQAKQITAIVTTEKDAVRLQLLPLPEPLRKMIYLLPCDVSFESKQSQRDFDEYVVGRVKQLVG